MRTQALRQQRCSRTRRTENKKHIWAGTCFSWDFPDVSGTALNICAFPTLLQDQREVQTATVISGSRNGGRGADLAIFAGIWTHASCPLLLGA
jgi:hypothetical protein